MKLSTAVDGGEREIGRPALLFAALLGMTLSAGAARRA
jgi:hypothetical protein